jgi:quercetin dioxygenase-like cupin family protein
MARSPLSVLPGAPLGAVAASGGVVACAPRELEGTELIAVAHHIAAQQDLWHPHARHDPLRRTFHEVARTDLYSAWLICWMPGHDTGFHDHDGSAGVGLVLRGRVAEDRLTIGGAPIEQELGPGQHFGFSANDIHRVRHVGEEPAVTLHVYSPVLLRMGAYEVLPNGTLRRHTLDESQELRPLTLQ